MNPYRWLLVMEDTPAGPEQRYRLWLVPLDEEYPAAPLRCDSIDAVYQALMDRLQTSRTEPPTRQVPDSEAEYPVDSKQNGDVSHGHNQ